MECNTRPLSRPSNILSTSVIPLSSLRPPGLTSSVQINPSQKTRPQISSRKTPIQQPTNLECNIRPPSRPSNLLPTSVQPLSSLRPPGLIQTSPSKATRHTNPSPESLSRYFRPNNLPSITSFRPPSYLYPASAHQAQPAPSKSTRHKKPVPKSRPEKPPSIPPPTLECNIRPLSRQSNLLPTSVNPLFGWLGRCCIPKRTDVECR